MVGFLVGLGFLVGFGSSVGTEVGGFFSSLVGVNGIGVLDGVGVRVGVLVAVIVAVTVAVAVGDGVFDAVSMFVIPATDVNVGVKKRLAKASLVSARLIGVAVAVYRGLSTISGRVSVFALSMMKGKLNAIATLPRRI